MLINVSYKHKVRDSFLIKIRAMNCYTFTVCQTFVYINNCVCVSNLISTSQYALWPFILGLSAYIFSHELMALKTKFKKWILFAFVLEASLCFPPAPRFQRIPNKH